MKYFRDRISAKLFLSYFAVLLVGAAVLLGTVLLTAPAAYNRHMMDDVVVTINGTPVAVSPGMMRGMGQGPVLGRGFGEQGFANFRAGVLDALGYAVAAAVLVAVGVSLLFSRQIIAPLRAMMSVSQRIADGRYDERVTVSGSDELAQLAEQFNRMAERLEQIETMRRQLIGDVSHELRTPLTAIGGYMEGLADGVLPATPETFEQVRMEAGRLSRLVDDLQELSRVEAGSYRLDIHPAALSTLVDTTIKRLSHQFDEKQVTLTRSLSSDLPLLLADSDRITQVLTNLLANSLAYTPAGGEVTVSALKTGGEVLVSVKDTGFGIPAESLPHIFDRFYRVDKSRSRAAGGGSGIGLTIAKALVEAHGGRIRAESAGENLGSVFSFTLPVSKS
jgi:two-component system, OmpR family, sensor histidine kinase BaeS